MKKCRILAILSFTTFLSLTGCSLKKEIHDESSKPIVPGEYVYNKQATLSFSFDDVTGSYAKDNVSEKNYKVDYVFNEDNKDIIFKKPNDPLLKQGVHNKSLYMDGFSTKIRINVRRR